MLIVAFRIPVPSYFAVAVGPLGSLQRGGLKLAIPQIFDLNGLANGLFSHKVCELPRRRYRMAVELYYHIAALQSGSGCWRAAIGYVRNQYAAFLAVADLLRVSIINWLQKDPQIAASHLAVLHQ